MSVKSQLIIGWKFETKIDIWENALLRIPSYFNDLNQLLTAIVINGTPLKGYIPLSVDLNRIKVFIAPKLMNPNSPSQKIAKMMFYIDLNKDYLTKRDILKLGTMFDDLNELKQLFLEWRTFFMENEPISLNHGSHPEYYNNMATQLIEYISMTEPMVLKDILTES